MIKQEEMDRIFECLCADKRAMDIINDNIKGTKLVTEIEAQNRYITFSYRKVSMNNCRILSFIPDEPQSEDHVIAQVCVDYSIRYAEIYVKVWTGREDNRPQQLGPYQIDYSVNKSFYPHETHFIHHEKDKVHIITGFEPIIGFCSSKFFTANGTGGKVQLLNDMYECCKFAPWYFAIFPNSKAKINPNLTIENIIHILEDPNTAKDFKILVTDDPTAIWLCLRIISGITCMGYDYYESKAGKGVLI